MIEVKQLHKSFGNIKAVDGVSFIVKNGERFVILGTSGCGKTTTLKMINRLIEPDSGDVFINGVSTDSIRPEILRRRIGYVLQDTGLFPHYTVEQNVSVVPELLQWDRKKIKERATALLNKFGLAPATYLPLYPDQLSGGQRQRVGFARALMADPPVLLMDEPLGALDPVTRFEMQKEFKRLKELKDKTTILVTHDIAEAIELGDRICVMDKGKIQQTGTAIELLLHPDNDFVRNFFSHHKFLLQLKAIKLKDVSHLLQPGTISTSAIEITDDATLMEALELLNENENAEVLTVKLPKDDRPVSVTMVQLLSALHQKINS